MINKKPTLLIQWTAILILTLTIAYASTVSSSKNEEQVVSYTAISTAELQRHVEKLSYEKELPFEMGLELINRWRSESTSNRNI